VHQDIQRILFDAERIRARVHALGQAISRDLAGRDVVLLALLKGSVVFVADLLRAIDIPVRLDFAWVSSYGDGTESSGEIQIRVFPDGELAGRTVLIVDDILDTGRTLSRVVCVLLDKAARRKVPVEAHYVGFPVEDVFVVGYGLDHADRYRNLPYIGVLSPERYVPAPT
jgi:hypoxanthine phosphoribosyltransferase